MPAGEGWQIRATGNRGQEMGQENIRAFGG
jgi:hypothetical protein